MQSNAFKSVEYLEGIEGLKEIEDLIEHDWTWLMLAIFRQQS